MMAQIMLQCRNLISPANFNHIALRGLATTTTCLNTNVRAGVPKGTRFKTRPLTYDEAIPPSLINVRKGWLSWNTTNLEQDKEQDHRTAEITFEDLIIRKFIVGTWPGFLASEVIIKRRHNIIILSFLVSMERMTPSQIYFLKGYSEELLSHWFKSRVKLEIQTVKSKEDVVFKRI